MDVKEMQRLDDMLIIEKELTSKGYKKIAGIDEAGRGPLCGPVVAAAVILPENCHIEGLNDSKKLSEKKREKIYDEIINNKEIVWAVAMSDVDVIESINILNATKLAMKKALESLSVKADYVIIDGNQLIDTKIKQEYVISGDSKSQSIAAASIIAKVTRDRLIKELDEKYPEYGFAKHKGYGTKAHIEAIQKYGLCKIHRSSFCKKFVK